VIAIDTSALIAITNHELERQRLLEAIADADRCLISAVTLFETRMVTLGRFGSAGSDRLEAWLATFNPEIAAFDETQADAASVAFNIYGKGIHAKAKLNFGDCDHPWRRSPHAVRAS
jgi:ribonuclease VapC